MHNWCLQMPEKGIRLPRIVVLECCEPWCGCWELTLGRLEACAIKHCAITPSPLTQPFMTHFLFSLFCVCAGEGEVVFRIQLRTLHILDKYSTSEICPKDFFIFIWERLYLSWTGFCWACDFPPFASHVSLIPIGPSMTSFLIWLELFQVLKSVSNKIVLVWMWNDD